MAEEVQVPQIQIVDTNKPDFKVTTTHVLENEVLDGIAHVHEDEKQISQTLLNLYTDDDGMVMVHKILAQLKKNGIRYFSDIRVQELMTSLSLDPEGLTIHSEIWIKKLVTVDYFKTASRSQSCAYLLNKALSSNLTIPDFEGFCSEIRVMYEDLQHVAGGRNADYIPQLSRVDPTYWGISICTVDGQRFSIGDTGIPFCIQSCSKALNYAINVSEHGPDYVHRYLGKEPSGLGFNQIRLDKNGLPHNPMINPGAISCCSVLKKEWSLADRFDFTTHEYMKMAGKEFIGFSNATFLSEKSGADRNFAIGYYLKEHGVFPEGCNLSETLDLYFQLCSVEATADSAAVISATLANGGVCPTTREKCLTSDAVRNTLSLMFSCGLYDYSGEWGVEVGLPAKSGVAGSIFIVVPGVMGICVWSPPLDELGNSYRGIMFAKKLIEKFAFHQFDTIQGGVKKINPTLHTCQESREIHICNILSAASNNDMVLLTRYLDLGMDFNVADYDNRTALHLAVCNGHIDVVKFLINKGKVDVNFVDRWQSTALDDAIKYEFGFLERYLRKNGALCSEAIRTQQATLTQSQCY